MEVFKSKAKREQEKQERIVKTVEKIQRPPSNDVDTQGNPVSPKRPGYGTRGYDKSKEPQKQSVEDDRKWNRDRADHRQVRAEAESKFAENKRKAVKEKLAIKKNKESKA
jgi:hypothetical protein